MAMFRAVHEVPMWQLLLGIVLGLTGTVAAWLSSGLLRGWLERIDLIRLTRTRAALQRKVRRRQLFAEHLESTLRRSSEAESWQDSRYVDPEAEVEALRGARFARLRRVASLSRALITARERIVLLQGDPGSGKTVALRHVATTMLRRAMARRSATSIIPLYVSLRELSPDGSTVDAALIHAYVRAKLNQANSRDVEGYLDDEFDGGGVAGTWYFLFDSFDEIPAILTAGDGFERVVEQYADAIYTFMSQMSGCRAVIASRAFKGPRQFRFPRITIVPLNKRSKIGLIRRAALPADLERLAVDELVHAPHEDTHVFTANAMVLSLICEYIRSSGHVPHSRHQVFEAYIDSRLTRGVALLGRSPTVSVGRVRDIAQEVACLMATPGVGLAPERTTLTDRLAAQGFDRAEVTDALLALEEVRIGAGRPLDRYDVFAFAHRRFQEYFATCAVLARPDRLDRTELLTEPAWHEIAVTLLQTQDAARLEPTVAALTDLLTSTGDVILEAARQLPEDRPKPRFAWPATTERLLLIAHSGLGIRPIDLDSPAVDALRTVIGRLLTSIWHVGRRHDRKTALGLLGGADQATTTRLVERGLAAPGDWIAAAAYASVDRIVAPSTQIVADVRRSVVGRACGAGFFAHRASLRAQIRRLAQPEPLLRTLDLLLWLPIADLALAASAVLVWGVLVVPDAGLLVRGEAYSAGFLTATGLLLAGLTIPLSGALAKRSRLFSRSPAVSPLGRLWQQISAVIQLPPGALAVAVSAALRAVVPVSMIMLTGATAPDVGVLFWSTTLWMSTWLYSALYLIARGIGTTPWLAWAYPVVAAWLIIRGGVRSGRRWLHVERWVMPAVLGLTALVIVGLCLGFAGGVLLVIGKVLRKAPLGLERMTTLNDFQLGVTAVVLAAAAVLVVAVIGRIWRYLRYRRTASRAAAAQGQLGADAVRRLLAVEKDGVMAAVIVGLTLHHRLEIDSDGALELADFAAAAEHANRTGDAQAADRRPVNERTLDDVARLVDSRPNLSRQTVEVNA